MPPIRRVLAVALCAMAVAAVQLRPASAEVPRVMAAAAPSERANFELYFPPRDRAGLQALIEAQNRPDSPIYHQFLTPQQFARSFGPTAATLAQVVRALNTIGVSPRDLIAIVQSLRESGSLQAEVEII